MKIDFEGLILKKSGKLYKSKWSPRAKKYTVKNITDKAMFHIFDDCRLDDDVTLKDVLLLLQRDLDFWKIIIRNWVEEFVEVGLKKSPKKKSDNKKESELNELKYLELSYGVSIEKYNDKDQPELCFSRWPDFHGIGPDETGKDIVYGVCFTPINELVHLPIKLKNTIKISDIRRSYSNGLKGKYNRKYKEEEFKYDGGYSLGCILYGIIWELSFHGGPSMVEKASKKIFGMAAEVEKDIENVKKGKPSKFKTFNSVKDLMKDLNDD